MQTCLRRSYDSLSAKDVSDLGSNKNMDLL